VTSFRTRFTFATGPAGAAGSAPERSVSLGEHVRVRRHSAGVALEAGGRRKRTEDADEQPEQQRARAPESLSERPE
jgi:hypothetical protein